MTISPAQARQWLKKNTDNRPLRPGWVETLRAAWDRGEWKLTNASIGFSLSGRLLDGQHRLTMVSQLPEEARVPMNVTTGMDDDSFDALDQGMRRSISDLYAVGTGHASTAGFLARIGSGNSSRLLTPQAVQPFIDWVQPEFQRLYTFCPTTAPIFSSAPVRSAAVVQMKRGCDVDFILSAYRSMVLSHIDEMPYAARVLVQQRMSGKIISARSSDLFCRALRVFDSNQQRRITKIIVRDQEETIREVKDFITKSMATKKSPTKAGQVVAKPSAHSTRGGVRAHA